MSKRNKDGVIELTRTGNGTFLIWGPQVGITTLVGLAIWPFELSITKRLTEIHVSVPIRTKGIEQANRPTRRMIRWILIRF